MVVGSLRGRVPMDHVPAESPPHAREIDLDRGRPALPLSAAHFKSNRPVSRAHALCLGYAPGWACVFAVPLP